VTPSTALRLAKYFGTTAEFWMSLQLCWDLAQTEPEEQTELEQIKPRGPAVEEQLLYEIKDDVLQNMIKEGTAAQAVPAQIRLPREVFKMLERRSKAQGTTPAQQIVEMVIAFLQGEVDPILQPDDPLLSIPVTEGTDVGDLASDHDRYLYRKDW
jgi:hypothetical protein